MINLNTDTIVAPATAAGVGAIAVIRLSGPQALDIVEKVFVSKSGKAISVKDKASHTLHFGCIADGQRLVDEVVLSLYRNPRSYTGEDVVELSCHGSPYIVGELLELFQSKGARIANAGEFTQRAFLNRKLDLSQAEAVADVIASNSKASHKLALQQMRGGFSMQIKDLREELIQFASLIELELDFGEEDVTFADRGQLVNLVSRIIAICDALYHSFRAGNVLKEGVPVVIAGKPNAGKSTLLNALLNEDRAIVSDIAGTTRDVIEETMTLDGILFRFIDTAGIRSAQDTIESFGIERTYGKIRQAEVVLYLFDIVSTTKVSLDIELAELYEKVPELKDKILVLIANKTDQAQDFKKDRSYWNFPAFCFVSAKKNQNLEELNLLLLNCIKNMAGELTDTIVTSARHAEALLQASQALDRARVNLEANRSGDMVALDIRQSLHYLGLITGEIATDDLLASIFSRFCIGK